MARAIVYPLGVAEAAEEVGCGKVRGRGKECVIDRMKGREGSKSWRLLWQGIPLHARVEALAHRGQTGTAYL